MVKYSDETLDRTFAALADPTRRALLARLETEADGVPVSILAQPFSMSLPAILKHLKVLSDAGLVSRKKTGRTVTCRLNADPMEHAMDWLEHYQRFWTERLDRLANFVEEDPCPQSRNSQQNQASHSSGASTRRPKRSTRHGRTPRR
ncbi:MAG: metalloregulator ArsR/SmtB family transcription factor [Methyloceanibacter sp.]|nr:metalloregulator ArsR/SmtB family transcription factor [Methyloceanibacter sp.]